MKAKQRAIGNAEKEERRHAILDAAEALYLEQPERMANVAEVAGKAGLAKGTVYLYFPSKEEMLLALHERHVATFFAKLEALLAGPGPFDYDAIFEVARRHIIHAPGYLALTSRCFGLMDREIPLERALEFKVRVGQMLASAGERLERHFPALAPGDGVALLCNSYALLVGLWQLMHPNERLGPAIERPELAMFRRDYEQEARKAVHDLWNGALQRPAPPASRRLAK